MAAENDTPPEEDEDRGKAALTELFQQVRNEKTPVMVERVVSDIDEIVRLVRFPGWQQTSAGELGGQEITAEVPVEVSAPSGAGAL